MSGRMMTAKRHFNTKFVIAKSLSHSPNYRLLNYFNTKFVIAKFLKCLNNALRFHKFQYKICYSKIRNSGDERKSEKSISIQNLL